MQFILNSKLKNLIKFKGYQQSYTLEAGGFIYDEISGIALTGYNPVGIVGYNTGSSSILSANFNIVTGGKVGYWIRNVTNQEVSAILYVNVMYLRAT